MPFDTVKANLEKKGFIVSVFPTAEKAVLHIADGLKGETVGFGGSVTLQDIGLFDALSGSNTVISHWTEPKNRDRYAEFTAYATSANAVAETGELVNIDGSGNRLSASLYGPKKMYFVIGRNKLTPDLPSAIARARNVASPINAKRLGRKTPCAETGKCHDCNSPERICRALLIHMLPMKGADRTEVVFIDADLGF